MYQRIEINPKILAGQPVIKGTRIPVYMILKTLKSLKSFEEVIKQYPGITSKDIQEALDFASNLSNFKEVSFTTEA
ncbi:MAG: DUF433 domain-containing protein [Candidatus Hodarchaeales archaeon]|jgi:uncharacterized protein (DUF433 family)